MRRDGLEEEDASFKAMADLEDSGSHLNNDFDFNSEGKFIKGKDGYGLGERATYHDLDGEQRSTKTPSEIIIGKTSHKVEHFTDDHPANKNNKSVMEKIQKSLAYVTSVMDLDEAG